MVLKFPEEDLAVISNTKEDFLLRIEKDLDHVECIYLYDIIEKSPYLKGLQICAAQYSNHLKFEKCLNQRFTFLEINARWEIDTKTQVIIWSILKEYNNLECLQLNFLFDRYDEYVLAREIWFLTKLRVFSYKEHNNEYVRNFRFHSLNQRLTNPKILTYF